MPKYGLIDLNGKEVLPCQYNALGEPYCGLLVFRHKPGEKFGYIDIAGKEVIAPTFHSGGNFDPATGTAYVRETRAGKDYYGRIDTTGRPVIPLNFADIREPSEGLSLFKSHDPADRYGYLDLRGNVVVPAKYANASRFSCGMAGVVSADDPDRVSFIDHSGKRVLGPFEGGFDTLQRHGMFTNRGVALFFEPTTHRGFLMDRTGRPILKQPAGVLFTCLREDLIEVQDTQTHKYGYMNFFGKWVVEPKYVSVFGPSDGYATVMIDDGRDPDDYTKRLNVRQGLIDSGGRMISAVGLRSCGFVGCGRINFTEKTPAGYRDGYLALPSGEVVIPPRFWYAGRYSEGFAVVRTEGN